MGLNIQPPTNSFPKIRVDKSLKSYFVEEMVRENLKIDMVGENGQIEVAQPRPTGQRTRLKFFKQDFLKE